MEPKEFTADQIHTMLRVGHKGPFENFSGIVRLGDPGQRIIHAGQKPDTATIGPTGVAAEGIQFVTTVYTYASAVNPIITMTAEINPPPTVGYFLAILSRFDYAFLNGFHDTSQSPNTITTSPIGRILCDVVARPNRIVECSMLFDAETAASVAWTGSATVVVLYF